MVGEFIRNPFGSKTPTTPRYNTQYFGLTPEQIGSSNYPDEYFVRTALEFYRGGREYRLELQNPGLWRSKKFEVPTILLYELFDGRRTDEEILEFTSLLGKIHATASHIGKPETYAKLDRDRSEARVEVFNYLWEGDAHARVKQIQIGGLLGKLASQGIKPEPDGWSMTWYSGMTYDELVGCNFSEGPAWKQVIDQLSGKRLSFPDLKELI